MFGLGFSEIAVLAVLGLILLGPEQLPDVARTLGRFFSDLKRSTDELTDEFKKANISSENLIEEIRTDLRVEDNPVVENHQNNEPEPVQLEMDTEYEPPTPITTEQDKQEKDGKKSDAN
jgi:sec-independent protein translocase protein TatB